MAGEVPVQTEERGLIIRETKRKGKAVFASRRYRAGELVIEGRARPGVFGRNRATLQTGPRQHVWPLPPLLHVNHSCEPTCRIRINRHGIYDLIALRDLEPDEEITFDYCTCEWELDAFPLCLCGVEGCRETLSGTKDLPVAFLERSADQLSPYCRSMRADASPKLHGHIEPSGRQEVVAFFESPSGTHRVRLHSEDVALRACAESFAAAALLPGMRQGLPLQLSLRLDARFHDNLARIQSLQKSWDPSLHLIAVEAPTQTGARSPGPRVGLFFSGGVDSMYSLLKHRDEITDLIVVHGFDIPLADEERCRQAEEQVRRIGAHFGKRVIKITTDIRTLTDPYAECGGQAHGAVMAAVAHLLGDEFGWILISASDSSAEAVPWGSHREMDPLWSTAALRVEHDGIEASRLDKLRLIVDESVALENLRVCWKNEQGMLNCGVCEKCIRTMIALRVLDALHRCPAFSNPLRLRRVAGLTLSWPGYTMEELNHLEDLRHDRLLLGLRAALQLAVVRSRLRLRLRAWRRGDVPSWQLQ